MHKFFNFLYKHRIDIFLFVLLAFLITFICILIPNNETKNIITHLENKTFDLRQQIISKKKIHNEDIVIITVDDPSYEVLVEKYGDWPIPRSVYADILDYIQAQKPQFVAFDLLFIKSLNRIKDSDKSLINGFRKYKNTYTAMNFDSYSKEMRTPPDLDDRLKAHIEIKDSDIEPFKYTNCRQILDEIVDESSNIGHINTPKSDDGFIRKVPVLINYKNDLYPYMTLKVASDYLNAKNPKIENNNLILNDKTLPLTKNAEVILNWYGPAGTYKYISMWEIIKSIEAKENNKKEIIPSDTFKNKIVFIGTSVYSLSDIKTVPTSKYIPGVEIHATLLNNIIDNNLIKEATPLFNTINCILLALLVGITVFCIRSVFVIIPLYAIELIIFSYTNTFIMEKYNIWTCMIIPILVSILIFIATFIIKYLIKSRDFEYTYKLATTDGLTELYNHRFFQEKMLTKIEDMSKNNGYFSLIMIDIDFFKKFNDRYGHQAGDAVLKHVAKTLKSSVRSEDYVCRYGGEEMTIILNRANKETSVQIANKICKTISEKDFELTPDLSVNVTISLGVATYPENGKTPTELIEYADKCLYKAKENGRNQVGYIEEEK